MVPLAIAAGPVERGDVDLGPVARCAGSGRSSTCRSAHRPPRCTPRPAADRRAPCRRRGGPAGGWPGRRRPSRWRPSRRRSSARPRGSGRWSTCRSAHRPPRCTPRPAADPRAPCRRPGSWRGGSTGGPGRPGRWPSRRSGSTTWRRSEPGSTCRRVRRRPRCRSRRAADRPPRCRRPAPLSGATTRLGRRPGRWPSSRPTSTSSRPGWGRWSRCRRERRRPRCRPRHAARPPARCRRPAWWATSRCRTGRPGSAPCRGTAPRSTRRWGRHRPCGTRRASAPRR